MHGFQKCIKCIKLVGETKETQMKCPSSLVFCVQPRNNYPFVSQNILKSFGLIFVGKEKSMNVEIRAKLQKWWVENEYVIQA